MADKSINLMPEDLRSKEEQILSKKKDNFEPDFVVPGKENKPAWTKTEESGPTFWSRLANIFKSKPKAPKPAKQDKKEVAKISKPAEDEQPLTDLNVNSGQIQTDLNDDKRDFNIPELKPIKFSEEKEKHHKEKKHKEEKAPEMPKIKKSGPSFWSRFARLFKSKPKAPKPPKEKHHKEKKHKEEKAPAPVKIIEQDFSKKEESVSVPAPEPAKIIEHKEEPKIPDKFVSLHKPEEKPTPPPAPTPTPVIQQPVVQKQDFSIPEEKPTPPQVPTPVPAPTPVIQQPVPDQKIGGFHTPEPRIRARFLNDDSGVDLIPTAAKTRSWKQISNLIVISIVGSLAVLILFYGGLIWYDKDVKNQKELKSQQISDIEEQIISFKDMNDEIKNLGDEIKLVHGLLNQHIYWTNFFELLEKYTVEGVYYTGFSAGINGGLTLSAIGPDFATVAKQLKVLQQEEASEFVTSVSITSASGADTGVSFGIVLVLNEDLFYYQEPDSENNQN